jgi:3-methyladenine DNA glycosylase/8-oxoguanine DNA glycosylase
VAVVTRRGRLIGALRLRGAGAEPVDLARTLLSHGCASLPPMQVAADGSSLEATLRVRGARPRTVVVTTGGRHRAAVRVLGPTPGEQTAGRLLDGVTYLLRLDEDLSAFYEIAAADPSLAWATAGAGRMLRSQTVFEDIVKTVCTTNCAWSATERMVGALVEHLGEPAFGSSRRVFPTAAAMATAGEDFYRDVARAGYRGRYLADLARGVAEGEIDPERMADPDLPDDEVEAQLLALPGVGPYAAAHVMLMLGRYSRLILDSWTRPTYARLAGKRVVGDAAIRRRFARYGQWAGLAFWLMLTRDWVPAPARGSQP